MKFGFGRRFLFGFMGMFAAVAATWFLPGATGHGLHDLVAQAAPVHVAQQPAATPPATQPPAAGQAATATPTVQEPAPPPPPPVAAPVSLPQRFTGLIGIALIILLGYALSHHREAVKWKIVAWGLSLQVLFAIFVLRIPFGQRMFHTLGDAVTAALHYSYAGSEFVFGELGKANSSLGVIFAFQVLPAIIFISALFAILYYLGVMQVVVRGCAVVMSKLLGASGAESLNVGASIFMGQTEAPLTIRPFLPTMTYSELMTVMTAGMAHVSGSIMAAYIAFGVEARHLLTAVIMTAPGTRSEERRVGKECEVPCRSRWSPYH